jgi:hypothetical protein
MSDISASIVARLKNKAKKKNTAATVIKLILPGGISKKI